MDAAAAAAVAEAAARPVERSAAEAALAGGRLVSDALAPELSYYELELGGGTPCGAESPEAAAMARAAAGGDGASLARAVTVRFRCGRDGESIESVEEDATCHYTLLFSTPSLCGHASFQKRSRASQHVVCRPDVSGAT